MPVMLYTKAQAQLVRFVSVFVANILVLYVDNESTKWNLSIGIQVMC